MTKKTGILAILLLLFVVFSARVKYELSAGNNSPLGAIKTGEAMPDFTLQNLSGDELTLSKAVSQNKVIMINFWASWCGPCRVEMPGFEKLYSSRSKDGLVILGVNEDSARADMDKYLAERPVSFPILVDQQSALMKKLGVRALPTTILVGADGKVTGVFEGVNEYMDFVVEGLLKAPQPIAP